MSIKSFTEASLMEREEILEKAQPLIDFTDPYVYFEWHHANMAFAAMGGPQQDALGIPDPRTAQHLEQFLINTHQALQLDFLSLTHFSPFLFFHLWCRIGTPAGGLLFFPDIVRATHTSHPPANQGATLFQLGSHGGDMAAEVRIVTSQSAGVLQVALHYFQFP